MIRQLGGAYCYADTDSVKYVGAGRDDLTEIFRRENEIIMERLRKACSHHGFSEERLSPATAAGKVKPLGVWEHEETYQRFKALRAKCYLWETDKELSLTVSGLNKKAAAPFLLTAFGPEMVFDGFDDGFYIPGEHTGKLTHRYINHETRDTLIDYLGTPGEVYEKSSIHMEPCPYEMGLTAQIISLMQGRRDIF